MKRFHIHIAVNDLSDSIRFYSSIFGVPPSLEREDYAKWKLDDPSVNFAISKRGHASGVNHLGIQVDSEDELTEVSQRINGLDIPTSEQENSACCYAQSNKYWTLDPQGIAWEAFHTLEEIPVFGKDTQTTVENESSACCIPLNMTMESDSEAACCIPNEKADCCS